MTAKRRLFRDAIPLLTALVSGLLAFLTAVVTTGVQFDKQLRANQAEVSRLDADVQRLDANLAKAEKTTAAITAVPVASCRATSRSQIPSDVYYRPEFPVCVYESPPKTVRPVDPWQFAAPRAGIYHVTASINWHLPKEPSEDNYFGVAWVFAVTSGGQRVLLDQRIVGSNWDTVAAGAADLLLRPDDLLWLEVGHSTSGRSAEVSTQHTRIDIHYIRAPP